MNDYAFHEMAFFMTFHDMTEWNCHFTKYQKILVISWIHNMTVTLNWMFQIQVITMKLRNILKILHCFGKLIKHIRFALIVQMKCNCQFYICYNIRRKRLQIKQWLPKGNLPIQYGIRQDSKWKISPILSPLFYNMKTLRICMHLLRVTCSSIILIYISHF